MMWARRLARRGYLRIKNKVRDRYDIFQARRHLMPDILEGERVARWMGYVMIPGTIFGIGGALTYRTHDKVAARLAAEEEPRGPRR
jgi:hypothetical protein